MVSAMAAQEGAKPFQHRNYENVCARINLTRVGVQDPRALRPLRGDHRHPVKDIRGGQAINMLRLELWIQTWNLTWV